VPESVECSECSTRYDSDVHPFCPRCGSTRASAPAPAGTLATAARNDPSRRRVQASGAVWTTVGGLMALLFVPMLFLAGPLTEQTLEQLASQEPGLSLPGGTLAVHVLDGGAPVPGAPVVLRTPLGVEVANGTTDGNGTFTAVLGSTQAVVHAEAQVGNGTVLGKAVSLEGSTTTLVLDPADPPTGWAGLGEMLVLVRVVLGVFIAVALLLVAAGILALRLKAWGFCVTAGAIGLLPGLMLAVASPGLGFLLILAVLAFPLGFVAAGRRHFR
jgi:hypothetical protein